MEKGNDKGPFDPGAFGDGMSEELDRMRKDEQKLFHNAAVDIRKKVEERLRLFMYDVGDFDPRHYQMEREHRMTPSEDGGKVKAEVFYRLDYVGTPAQKKKAVNILKRMYGKKFKEMVLDLHPNIQVIMDPEEFGNMITEDDIMKEFRKGLGA